MLIDGDRILGVGPQAAVHIPEGAEVFDASGHTVMPRPHRRTRPPGLGRIRPHWPLGHGRTVVPVKHKTAQVIEDTLAAGYTTVRDAGGLDAGFKMAVDQGLIKGPRLIISVNIMSPTGGIEDKVSGSGHRKVILGHDPFRPTA